MENLIVLNAVQKNYLLRREKKGFADATVGDMAGEISNKY